MLIQTETFWAVRLQEKFRINIYDLLTYNLNFQGIEYFLKSGINLNPFWQDVFRYWTEIHYIKPAKFRQVSPGRILSCKIQYNQAILKKG